jgi:hypothetical protein
MADLWDRIRNVWDRNQDTAPATGEETGTVQQQLAAQRLAGRDEVALEVASALNKVRADIRKDWTEEALDQPGKLAELTAKYQARIEDYNRVALGLMVLGEDKLSVNLPNVIHPEEMARGVKLTVEQSVLGKEQVIAQSSQPVALGVRLQEQLQEIRDSWVQDLQTNQMRPAQADMYYAGRLDQFKESVAEGRSVRSEQRESIPELPAFSEVKAQVQSQLRQANQQSESVAV